jgi:hypothetical protein
MGNVSETMKALAAYGKGNYKRAWHDFYFKTCHVVLNTI